MTDIEKLVHDAIYKATKEALGDIELEAVIDDAIREGTLEAQEGAVSRWLKPKQEN